MGGKTTIIIITTTTSTITTVFERKGLLRNDERFPPIMASATSTECLVSLLTKTASFLVLRRTEEQSCHATAPAYTYQQDLAALAKSDQRWGAFTAPSITHVIRNMDAQNGLPVLSLLGKGGVRTYAPFLQAQAHTHDRRHQRRFDRTPNF